MSRRHCEAMGAWADHNLVTLAREFNPHCRSEIWFGNAHLPPLTQAVKEDQYFQAGIKGLGSGGQGLCVAHAAASRVPDLCRTHNLARH